MEPMAAALAKPASSYTNMLFSLHFPKVQRTQQLLLQPSNKEHLELSECVLMFLCMQDHL